MIKYTRLSPSIFSLHAASNWKLDGGKAWERGYEHWLFYRLVSTGLFEGKEYSHVYSELKHQTHRCILLHNSVSYSTTVNTTRGTVCTKSDKTREIIETFTIPKNTPWEKKYHDWLIDWFWFYEKSNSIAGSPWRWTQNAYHYNLTTPPIDAFAIKVWWNFDKM